MLPGGETPLTQCDSCERMATAEEGIRNLEGDVGVLGKKIDKLNYLIMTGIFMSFLTLVGIVAKSN